MFLSKKEDYHHVLAAMYGKAVAIEDIDEPIFAGKVVGDGIAIKPVDGEVVAPISGVVSIIGEGYHSYGITGYDQVEVLLHIGIDTTKLHGKGFQSLVKKGDVVKAGDVICNVDIKYLEDNGYDTTSPLIITSNAMSKIKRLKITTGDVQAGKSICLSYIKEK